MFNAMKKIVSFVIVLAAVEKADSTKACCEKSCCEKAEANK